jgi:hypothetical protein
MRGYQQPAVPSRAGGRSIPADAGLPSISAISTRTRQVYPRGCGATPMSNRSTVGMSGLSPRMRGYRREGAPEAAGDRSIPADAGLPEPSRQSPAPGKVYPRGCGAT